MNLNLELASYLIDIDISSHQVTSSMLGLWFRAKPFHDLFIDILQPVLNSGSLKNIANDAINNLWEESNGNINNNILQMML